MGAPRKALSSEALSPTKHTDIERQTETESLPVLFTRLADDVMQLVDTKLSLLKVEIREEANAYARASILIAIGGVIAAIGFSLLNVAIAFGVSSLFESANLSQPMQYAIGFVLTGLFYLLVGGVVVMVMKNRMARFDLLPNRTVEELRKDKQWLKNEL